MCSSRKKNLILQMAFSYFVLTTQLVSTSNTYNFVVREASYTRLCSTKNILTVNGEFPGPTIRARQGDTITVNVHNKGRYNVTLHWHGVGQPRNPWSDGPEYITQCPIKPGGSFRQKLILSTEVGTLWWHAHSDWLRATVHGAIIIYPKQKAAYPFPKPHADIPIILGEWWKSDVTEVFTQFLRNGGDPNVSDAITVNGQPGDLYPCSKSETFRLSVQFGKTYLLRLVNAAMNLILFFSVAQHKLTIVGMDGRYLKPFTRDYLAISPGQTMDVLLHANQNPNQYYMASRANSVGVVPAFDNTTATAILQYTEDHDPNSSSSSLPYLPNHNDTVAAFSFFTRLRSLGSKEYPTEVPLTVSHHMTSTLTLNTLPCATGKCAGPNGTRLGASMSNISFIKPKQVDILEAYYYNIKGVYSENFPNFSPSIFNLTAGPLVQEFLIPERGTKVKVLPFGSVVELVFLGSSFFGGIEHPMHLHGICFYVVGYGIGNFDKHKDPLEYNLIDPPLMNTVTVPRNGWVAIRFNASNPGVWFMHCHFERHIAWGMETVFIVRNGKDPNARVLPPPRDMPPC